jgi:hypothetical protein
VNVLKALASIISVSSLHVILLSKCDAYGWYTSQIRRVLCSVDWIYYSVTHAHLVTMEYKQYQRYLHRLQFAVATH